MMVQLSRLFILIFLLAPGMLFAQQNTTEAVSLFNTQKRVLHSEVINEDFDIYVGLPFGYNPEANQYRVMYVLDANVTFGMVNNMMNLISFEQGNPPTIIIGIAYPSMNGWIQKRSRDYTPNKVAALPNSGGASSFLKFLKEELMPYVDENYPINEDQNIIYGHSTAALLGLYALFTDTDLFNSYIITSPSVDEDEGFMLKMAKNYEAQGKTLHAQLFISYGVEEKDTFKTEFLKLKEHFDSLSYEGLSFKSQAIEATHMESMAPAFLKGVQFINGLDQK